MDATNETPPTQSSDDHRSMSRIAAWIDRQPRVVLSIYAMVAAFAAYGSMYAFRKPFAASSYEGLVAFTVFDVAFDFKTIAVIAQLLGYVLSKFIGIKIASEASFWRRVPLVLGLIVFAELMLVFFGLVAPPYNLIFLFLNGLPLGMVWSLLFGLLEGRRVTEFLGLAMSVSVIFSSSWVKAVGRLTIDQWNVDPFWMPALTGLIFSPVLLLSLAMLYHLPPPDAEDCAQRTRRAPMNREMRRAFLRQYSLATILLIGGYLCLMTYRDVRDQFMPEILADLGYIVDAGDFASIDTWVGLVVIVVLSVLWGFKSNRAAVWANMVLMSAGAILLGLATVLVQNRIVGPTTFYILNGIGLYVAFVPYQSILIDRLLASLNAVATASFLIILADAFGYVSTVTLYVSKDIYAAIHDTKIQWSTVLMWLSYVVMLAVPISLIGCGWSLRRHLK